MKKWGLIVSLLITFSFLFGMIGCAKAPATPGTPTTPTKPTAPATSTTPTKPIEQSFKPIKMRFSTHLPPVHHQYKNVTAVWAAEVEKRTGGRIKVELYPNESLGKYWENFDLVKTGAADAAMSEARTLAAIFPLAEAFALPFLMPDRYTVPGGAAVADTTIEKWLLPAYFKDVKVLWWGQIGGSAIQMVKKPIRKMDDMKGVLVVVASKPNADWVKMLGGSPEVVPSIEMYTALERKMVEGAVIPISTLMAYRLIEFVKYITMFQAGTTYWYYIMGTPFRNRLSPTDQKIIDELSVWAKPIMQKSWEDEVAFLTKEAQKAGIEVIILPTTELKRLSDTLFPLHKVWIADMEAKGLPGQKMYDDIIKLKAELIK